MDGVLTRDNHAYQGSGRVQARTRSGNPNQRVKSPFRANLPNGAFTHLCQLTRDFAPLRCLMPS